MEYQKSSSRNYDKICSAKILQEACRDSQCLLGKEGEDCKQDRNIEQFISHSYFYFQEKILFSMGEGALSIDL